MRMRRKRNLTARIEQCAEYLVDDPVSLRGLWRSVFQFSELHIELGCGKGLFTIETAKASPDVFIAALEKMENVIVAALERTAANGLRNVRYINANADNLSDFFAPAEASRIYINFCDPWPADRHAKRRLTHRRFLEQYKLLLRHEGEVHFKTDNLPLFEFSLDEFLNSGFRLCSVKHDLHKDGPCGIMTDYEMKFYEKGLPIAQCVFASQG